jgi:multicomponent K+:H+ antiporter subunit G
MSEPALQWLGETAIAMLILLGGFFLLIGAYALAKLPDTMRRLHGPTKSATLGVGCLLLASMLYFLLVRGHLSFHELLITIFLFLTAPVTALMVAKAHILRDREQRRKLPPTGRPVGWATLDIRPEPRRPTPASDA